MITVQPIPASPELRTSAGGGGHWAIRLQALILLSGSVRPTPMTEAIDRSLLDLPVDAGRTLLDHWAAVVAHLLHVSGQGHLPIRVLTGHEVSAPTVNSHVPQADIQIEQDQAEFRGTGGVLRDACAAYGDEDYILMANAAQLLVEPLADLTADLASTGADVALVGQEDGTPSGLMLIRCGCLRRIPEVGFVDMKEQALTQIAKDHRVAVVQRRQPAALPIRTLADYISALQWYYRSVEGGPRKAGDAFAEDWYPTFSLVEDGATVDPTARIHDSVILRGGRVEKDAVLVRSLVGPGGVVRRGRAAVEQVISDGRA